MQRPMPFTRPIRIPRPGRMRGAVIFLTCMSSETIYPPPPVFLPGTLSVGPLVIGVMEGAAERSASQLWAAS